MIFDIFSSRIYAAWDSFGSCELSIYGKKHLLYDLRKDFDRAFKVWNNWTCERFNKSYTKESIKEAKKIHLIEQRDELNNMHTHENSIENTLRDHEMSLKKV